MHSNFLCSFIVAVAATVCLNTTPVWAQDTDEEGAVLVEFPIENPASLGIGWNFVDNKKTLQNCVVHDVSSLSFQDRRAQLSVVEDHEALSNALDVSVTAKYRAVMSNFSASARFVTSTKFEARSTHVAIMAEVDEGPQFVVPVSSGSSSSNVEQEIKNVRLLPAFVDLASTDIDEFYRQCGQGFVAVVHSGARINAVLTFSNTTQNEHEAISVSLSGGGGGASFSASFKRTMDSFTQAERFNVSYLGLGGAADTIPLSKEGLISAVEGLPKVSAAAPRPFTMIVQRYEELPNWPSVIVPSELSDAELLANTYWRLFTLQSYVQEALFDDGWLLILDANRDDVLALDLEIQETMQGVKDALWSCVVDEKCQTEKWQSWNDYSLRARLPFKGSWQDIPYNASNVNLEEAVEYLVAARAQQWLIPVWRNRCSRGECVPAQTIDDLQSLMRRNSEAMFE